MTNFDYKRLDHFIKVAETNGWIQLGKGDIELLEFINKNIKDAAGYYDVGFQEGFDCAREYGGDEEETRNEDQFELLNELTK